MCLRKRGRNLSDVPVDFLALDLPKRNSHLEPLSTFQPQWGRMFLFNIVSLGHTFLIQKGLAFVSLRYHRSGKAWIVGDRVSIDD